MDEPTSRMNDSRTLMRMLFEFYENGKDIADEIAEFVFAGIKADEKMTMSRIPKKVFPCYRSDDIQFSLDSNYAIVLDRDTHSIGMKDMMDDSDANCIAHDSTSGTSQSITAVALSPDKQYVAVALSDPYICIWKNVSGRYQRLHDIHDVRTGIDMKSGLHQDPACIRSMRFSPDGDRLVAITNTGRVYTFSQTQKNGSESETFLQVGFVEAEPSRTISEEISPCCQKAACMDEDGGVHVIDLSSSVVDKSIIDVLDIERPGRVSMSFSPDCRYLAASDRDHNVYMVDVPKKSVRGVLHYPDEKSRGKKLNVQFSPCGRMIAAHSDGADRICVWDLANKTKSMLRSNRCSSIRCVQFSPNGKMMCISGVSKTDSSPVMEMLKQRSGPLVDIDIRDLSKIATSCGCGEYTEPLENKFGLTGLRSLSKNDTLFSQQMRLLKMSDDQSRQLLENVRKQIHM